jgi:hypothetical protein
VRGRFLGGAKARVVSAGTPTPIQVVSGRKSGGRFDVPRGTRIHFDQAHFTDVDLSGQTFESIQARGSTFVSCDFSHSIMSSGVLGDIPLTQYVECDFTDADLRFVAPQFARFEDCTFSNTRLDNWDCHCSEFVECRFEGRILGATFSGQPWGLCKPFLARHRKINEFRGNDFRHAVLDDCSFLGGVEISDNKWPESSDYMIVRDLAAAVDHAWKRLPTLPDHEAEYAAGLLVAYSSGGFAVQGDLFVRKEDLGPALPLFENGTSG